MSNLLPAISGQTFREELAQQRWDDHRFYHHNRINQFLHLLSALCFLLSYWLVFFNPVAAVFTSWILAMVLRQIGHFFFEPKTYDEVNEATHDYKESVKVGYNLRRKVVLLTIWAALPIAVLFSPDLFGLVPANTVANGYVYTVSMLWLALGIGAVIFRTVHLFFLMGVQSGMVWCCKILSDPFHDVKIYYKAPYFILKGDMYDTMDEWYEEKPVSG